MTKINQDILEGFYSGNSKSIRVTVTDSQGQNFPLTNCELTYVIFNDNGKVFVRKSSQSQDEIEIDQMNTNICTIYLIPNDTSALSGLYRHMLNVVDNGQEETVMTGTIRIYKSYASRYRQSNRQAYLAGV